MSIVKATGKGQVVIPIYLRKKYNIKKGSKVNIYEGEGGVIIIKPLPDEPIEATRGILKGKTSLTEALLKDRKEEAERG
ncbi:MAG: AbrB/MazE/SpoVT family DNA-binding domain-containing protein [Thermodesulfovibrionales bacterium]|nr:AbrB/MazE/SpoVT family DNA-binding domain-containing protein [Thermodesulfovibrionales bacterium]